MAMQQLDGKVVLVTGAARGMGENHARRLVAAGARVVLTDVAEEAGRAVAKELGDAAAFVAQDVSREEDWDRAVSLARDRFGGLDGLVNNAALLRQALLEEEDPEGFERLLRVNVVGTWWGIRKAAPLLRAGEGGSIVNISSTAGLKAFPGLSSYMTSKWAVRGLTKAAAVELGPDGIRVNSIHPGGIEETGMFGSTRDRETIAEAAKAFPIQRYGTKDDISDAVLFLLSDASAYVTGTELVVDGGSVA